MCVYVLINIVITMIKVANTTCLQLYMCDCMQEDRVIELELFKLYHLDKEIKESQMKRRSVELELKQTVCVAYT